MSRNFLKLLLLLIQATPGVVESVQLRRPTLKGKMWILQKQQLGWKHKQQQQQQLLLLLLLRLTTLTLMKLSSSTRRSSHPILA